MLTKSNVLESLKELPDQMKKIFSNVLIIVLLFIISNGIFAQADQTQFNHAELFRKFAGTWKTDMGNNTIGTLEINPFYDGFNCSFQAVKEGKIVLDEKTLIGYDKKNGKLIESGIINSNPEMILWSLWFTSENKCEEVFMEDASNPEAAKNKWTFELASPDLFIWTFTVDNQPVNIFNFHRELK